MAYVYSGDTGNTIEIAYSETGRKYLAAGNTRKLDVKYFGFTDNDINYNLSVDRVPKRGKIPDLTGVDNSNTLDFLCYNTLNKNLNIYKTTLFSDENNNIKKGCAAFEASFCGENLNNNIYSLGNCLRFSSVSCYLNVKNSQLYYFDNNHNFVFEIWFRILPKGNFREQMFIRFGTSIYSINTPSLAPIQVRGYSLGYTRQRGIRFQLAGVGTLTTNPDIINVNTLYHLVLVKNTSNRNNWKIYINGIEQSLTRTNSNTNLVNNANENMIIGVLPEISSTNILINDSDSLNPFNLVNLGLNNELLDRMDILSTRVFRDMSLTNEEVLYYYNGGLGNNIKLEHVDNTVIDLQYEDNKGSLIAKDNSKNNLDASLVFFKKEFTDFNSTNPAFREYI
jgi:hypothetical protein